MINIKYTICILAFMSIGTSCSNNKKSKNEDAFKLVNTQAQLTEISGTETGGGGDAVNLQKALASRNRECLIHAVELGLSDSMLRGRLALILKDMPMSNYANSLVSATLQKMQANDIVADVMESKFIFSKKCVDKDGILRAATSGFKKGSVVCLNPEKIVDDLGLSIPESVIYGLLAHEFAHHFGDLDSTKNKKGEIIYPFGSAVADLIDMENKRIEAGGDRANDVVHPEVCSSPSFENMMKEVKYEIEF